VQEWSQRSSPKNKSKEESQFPKTFRRDKMTFWTVSSQVMKYGSNNTTLKRSSKVHNGRLPIPHNQKNSIGPYHEPNVADIFFYIRGIVHYEFEPPGQSTKYTIWKYWKGYMKKLETTQTFCQQLMDLASRQCTCSHGTVCEGDFSY